ncbi:hypothetical protein [Streptomyces sp. NBC_00009]|uniref:hypothetical protein n=1 Tax=Streptomyces sp. NBC_00009 TaxID=2975620 RepID=UPI003864E263
MPPMPPMPSVPPAPNAQTSTGSCCRRLPGRGLAKGELSPRADLFFGLTEGVILVHCRDPERSVPVAAPVLAATTADAAPRIAGP